MWAACPDGMAQPGAEPFRSTGRTAVGGLG